MTKSSLIYKNGNNFASIINNLSTHRAKIINILDFNSEKLSIIRTNKNKIHVYYDHNLFFFWLLII